MFSLTRSLTKIAENGEDVEELKKDIQEKKEEESDKAFKRAPLPYREVDLEPYLSPQQIDAHYNYHHKDYVDRIKKARASQGFITYDPKSGLSMNMDDPSLVHDANQAWNHDFYWKSMSPNGGGIPEDKLVLKAIEDEYESFSEFREKFIEEMLKITGMTGSAWGWLCVYREMEDMKIKTEIEIITTMNCKNPYLTVGKTPLCCIDLWEHAYYIDYGPNKEEYIQRWIDNLINWEFVSDNFHKALVNGMMGGGTMMPGAIGGGGMPQISMMRLR